MRLITLYIPDGYLKDIDRLIKDRKYPNRAEAIRLAVRDLIRSEVWEFITYDKIEESDSEASMQSRSVEL